jgi:hypothetical protein
MSIYIWVFCFVSLLLLEEEGREGKEGTREEGAHSCTLHLKFLLKPEVILKLYL